jgi:aminopeptidase N
MKLLLVLLSLIAYSATAQSYQPVDKTQAALITQEQIRHARLYGGGPNGVQGLSGASSNFNVHYYRCEWEVDPAIRYINGKVTVYFTMTAAGAAVVMDLMSSLTVDSVKQRNNLLSKQQLNNLLTINFSATMNAGSIDSFSVFYKGVPANTGFGSFIQDQHNGIPVIWSLSEPYGARDWWPCKNGLDDKADSIDILITHPSAYKAAANGLFQ